MARIPKVGDVVRGGDGKPWRVRCMNHDGSVLGLVPMSWWERMRWRWRLRTWRLL